MALRPGLGQIRFQDSDDVPVIVDPVTSEVMLAPEMSSRYVPLRLMLALGRDHTLVDEDLRPWFADIRDHVAHAAEMTDSLRDQLTTIRETQLNIQSNRLNLIMKKVTGWAAIIAIPTAITGFYGQNVPYPGSEQPWGFWISTTAIVLLSGGLYVMFKRKDWL